MNQPQAPVLYGKYQLLDLLARGGMAEVYKAKSHGVEGFEKILVIKRILPELGENPQFVEMFINEAKIAVTLSHANVVQVFDLGRAEGSYFIAMEYVAGYDLATILARGRKLGRPLPQELAVFVVSELAKGLDYAHRRRDSQLRPLHIVHRDVSPQNVLVSFEGEVKLTDFGIAKAALAVEEKTDAGVLKGKYAYMSPEQADGREVDAKTDLFALGTVLYELLAGVNPFFVPESTYETLRKVRTCDVKPISQRLPELPAELASIVERAMDPDAAARQANAGAMYEELVQFLYSSGRRVSGHDLADFLHELRRAGELAVEAPDDARLRAVFDQEGATPRDYSPEATPVEVPVARTGPRRSSPPRRSGSGVSRPTQERRDGTALVVMSPAPSFLEQPVVERLLRRFGGLRMKYEPPPGSPATLVALFGVRDPDGRDTEAAARCALRLARAARSGTQSGQGEVLLQAGIHAGRMLVDVEGEAVRDEAFEALCSRARDIADRAAPGQVCVSEEGLRPMAGLFETAPVGEGREARWAIQQERSVADASGKFVGRREELRRMGELLAAANRGRMKVVGITGEAGSGKSRLLHETRRRLQLGGHDVGMHVASCARQNRRVPLAGMQEMLRAVLGIDELEAEDEARDKTGRLRELGLGPAEIAAVSVALGIEPESGAEGEGVANPVQLLRPALGRMAIKLAEDRLTVFAWDGAENMDDESQALLDGFIRDTKDARVAVVLSYRPGFVHAWADVPSYFELHLSPMSDEDVARLTATRLAVEEVPVELLREVTAKSGGNPLYVEEYLKALADAGAIRSSSGRVVYDPKVAEVEVPKTLRGIVSSRLARLGPSDRHLLQVAAIAVERFTAALLARVTGSESGTVERALEVLEGRGLVASRGANEYDFAHELVGEVLRDGLTLESRRELHAVVAEAVEALHPQRLDELAEKMAFHHREAGDRGRAVDYMVRAANRLEGEHSLAGAVAALEGAIDLLSQMAQPDRERTIALYMRIGELSFRSRDLEGGARRMAAAVELSEALGRDADVARFSMMRGRLLGNLPGSSEEGRRWLDRAGDLARQLGDRRLLRDVILATAESEMRVGEHRMASGRFEEALTLSRDMGDAEAQTRCLIPLALASASDGRPERGLEALEEARRLTGEGLDRFTDCEMLKMESLVHFFARDYERSLEAGGKALELAKEYGFPYEAAVNAHNLGEAYLRVGDYRRAFASLRYSYEAARDRGWAKLQWSNMRVLGFIDATRFGSREGRDHVVQANEFASDRRFIWDLIQGRYYLAIIDQQRGDEDGARAGLREILRLAAEHGHSDYVRAAEKGLRALDSGSTIQLPG